MNDLLCLEILAYESLKPPATFSRRLGVGEHFPHQPGSVCDIRRRPAMAPQGIGVRSPTRFHRNQSVVDQVAKRVRRSEEHTSELQSRGHLVCRLLLEK